MNNEDINYNEIKISDINNNITDTNDKYIKFGLTSFKYTLNGKSNIYVSLNISRELYNNYKDYFIKGNKVFVKGYLNTYIDRFNKIQTFITTTDISTNLGDITSGRKEPHIRYDSDGVMVWNGKRCEAIPPTKEELQEMEELLSEFK